MSKQTLIVIGNGMVGHHFLEQFSQSPAAETYRVIVFGEEKQLAYDRVHLSEYFTGSTHADLAMGTADWYAEQGIDLRLNFGRVDRRRLDNPSRFAERAVRVADPRRKGVADALVLRDELAVDDRHLADGPSLGFLHRITVDLFFIARVVAVGDGRRQGRRRTDQFRVFFARELARGVVGVGDLLVRHDHHADGRLVQRLREVARTGQRRVQGLARARFKCPRSGVGQRPQHGAVEGHHLEIARPVHPGLLLLPRLLAFFAFLAFGGDDHGMTRRNAGSEHERCRRSA